MMDNRTLRNGVVGCRFVPLAQIWLARKSAVKLHPPNSPQVTDSESWLSPNQHSVTKRKGSRLSFGLTTNSATCQRARCKSHPSQLPPRHRRIASITPTEDHGPAPHRIRHHIPAPVKHAKLLHHAVLTQALSTIHHQSPQLHQQRQRLRLQRRRLV